MINRKTTFVLGAGASADFRFPSGRGLVLSIIKRCQPQHPLWQLFAKRGQDLEFLTTFAKDLDLSMQPSIDTFIQKLPHYYDLGKLAIAEALIPIENPSTLKRGPDKTTWLEYLFPMLEYGKSGVTSPIRFITFNYDRSLEFFLFSAFKHSLGLTNKEAYFLLNTIPIVHFYGQLGDFFYDHSHGRPYEPEANYDQIVLASRSISILNDRQSAPNFEAARNMLRDTEVLCFLGFGFHPLNVKLLQLNRNALANSDIFASLFSVSADEKRRIMKQLDGLNIITGSEHENCLDLLRNHPILD